MVGSLHQSDMKQLSATEGTRSKRMGSKWFIIGALVNDTICTVALCLDTYLIIRLSSSSQSMSSNNRLWPTAIWILTTTLATTFEQMYFLHRYWTISKDWIITCMLAVLILSNFVFILVIDAAFIPTGNNSVVLQKLDAPFVSSFIITARQLSTRRLLRKICIYVVGYGSITAISSMLLLVMWAVNVNGYMSIVYCMGRIYSLTVLCNFLFVSGWRDEAATTDIILDSNLTVKGTEFNSVLEDLPKFQLTSSNASTPANSFNLNSKRLSNSSTQLTSILRKDTVAPSFSMDTL
ncbi:hypothetical protein F5879DRAFT_612080 [Lentinula edodes]|nr:hypothetical protein F5879DRAFT_612080 [Lentinula edodes]